MPDRLNIESLIKSCCMRYLKRIFKANKNSEKVRYYNSLIKICVKLFKNNRCEYSSKSNKKCVTVNYLFSFLFYVN
jgi:rRNA-processing protein FCF1